MSAAPAQPEARWSELGLVAFVFGVLMCMILPMRPWMLDIMLALSISTGLLVMLVIIYLRDPQASQAFRRSCLSSPCFDWGLI